MRRLAVPIAVVLLAMGLLLPGPGRTAEPSAFAGWDALAFGMTEEEVAAALPEAEPLPGRFDFGPMHADRAVFDLAIAGIGFDAYLQMDDATGRLRQVLLQADRTAEGPADYERVLVDLAARYGEPDGVCPVPGGAGRHRRGVEVVWRGGATTLHAVFLDFRTTGVLGRDPNRDYAPLEPLGEARRVIQRFLPRRLLIRWHAAEDTGLDTTPGCR